MASLTVVLHLLPINEAIMVMIRFVSQVLPADLVYPTRETKKKSNIKYV